MAEEGAKKKPEKAKDEADAAKTVGLDESDIKILQSYVRRRSGGARGSRGAEKKGVQGQRGDLYGCGMV